MVSLWPFGKAEDSAASFEKTLSQLSDKITRATTRADRFKHRQRKYKALWTIYTVFGYILIDIVLIFIVRWEQWSWFEWLLVTGGPFGIYIVRMALHAYYDYRLSGSQEYLADLKKQRDDTIEKLKASTKYNSTQKLLEKYGGSSAKPAQSEQRKRQKLEDGKPVQNAPLPGRTGFAPPPTANIPGRQNPPGPRLPQDAGRPVSWAGAPSEIKAQLARVSTAPNEEFAPNAFSPTEYPAVLQASQQYAAHGPKWYDRLMDVILGDDETQAKNRIVLICRECRLVNGQAPPGARTLEDVGRWRCSSCHAWNGVESEEKRVLQHAARHEEAPSSPEVGSAANNLGGDYEHVDRSASGEDNADNDEDSGEDDKTEDTAHTTSSARGKDRSRKR